MTVVAYLATYFAIGFVLGIITCKINLKIKQRTSPYYRYTREDPILITLILTFLWPLCLPALILFPLVRFLFTQAMRYARSPNFLPQDRTPH